MIDRIAAIVGWTIWAVYLGLGAWSLGFAVWTWPSFKHWRWRKWGRPIWCPRCGRIHRCFR